MDASQSLSYPYFRYLLSLLDKNVPWLRFGLLSGYVTSAGVGSESVLLASRRALADFAESLPLHDPTTDSRFTQSDLREGFKSLLHQNLSNDRILIPTLESLGFLLEANLLGVTPPVLEDKTPVEDNFNWRSILVLTQKAHYQSTNVQKLEAAIKVYAGLLDVDSLRAPVTKKLLSMLLHPFPKVRRLIARSYVARVRLADTSHPSRSATLQQTRSTLLLWRYQESCRQKHTMC